MLFSDNIDDFTEELAIGSAHIGASNTVPEKIRSLKDAIGSKEAEIYASDKIGGLLLAGIPVSAVASQYNLPISAVRRLEKAYYDKLLLAISPSDSKKALAQALGTYTLVREGALNTAMISDNKPYQKLTAYRVAMESQDRVIGILDKLGVFNASVVQQEDSKLTMLQDTLISLGQGLAEDLEDLDEEENV